MTKKAFLYAGIFIGAVGITWALKAQQKTSDKIYSVSLPLSKWIEISNRLEAVKDVVRQSDVQARQATFVCDSILSTLQNVIGQQVNQQLASEQRKDTSKTKKP